MAVLNPTQPCHEEQNVKGQSSSQRKKHGRVMNLAWLCHKKTKEKKSRGVLKECMAMLDPTHPCYLKKHGRAINSTHPCHEFSMAMSQEDKGKEEHGVLKECMVVLDPTHPCYFK